MTALEGGASFSQRSINLAAPSKPTTGIKKLELELETPTSGTLRIAVLFTPEGGPTTPVEARPLAQWKGHGPTR